MSELNKPIRVVVELGCKEIFCGECYHRDFGNGEPREPIYCTLFVDKDGHWYRVLRAGDTTIRCQACRRNQIRKGLRAK